MPISFIGPHQCVLSVRVYIYIPLVISWISVFSISRTYLLHGVWSPLWPSIFITIVRVNKLLNLCQLHNYYLANKFLETDHRLELPDCYSRQEGKVQPQLLLPDPKRSLWRQSPTCRLKKKDYIEKATAILIYTVTEKTWHQN